MIITETSRLLIRELSVADAPFILTLTNTPEWLQFIGDRGIRSITDAENYILNGPMASYLKFNHGLYLVLLKEGDLPIGICGIIKRDTLNYKDIGFAFMPVYTGKGYALEAATAILQVTNQKLGPQRIEAITLPSNTRSIRLLGKLGFVFNRMVRFEGGNEDLMLFANEAAPVS